VAVSDLLESTTRAGWLPTLTRIQDAPCAELQATEAGVRRLAYQDYQSDDGLLNVAVDQGEFGHLVPLPVNYLWQLENHSGELVEDAGTTD